MDHDEFKKYLSVVKNDPFVLFPDPEDRFIYVDDNLTHVIIQNVKTQNHYHLALALVEFANPRIMRLYRSVRVFDGSFV